MLITQTLITNSSKNLTRSAIRYLGKETLYKDFLASVARLSYLHQHELGQGVRMAFLSRNSPAMMATFFAMTNTRSVSIPIDPDLPPDEIGKWLKESKATHIAVSSDLLTAARDILQAERLSLPIVEIEKKHGGEYDTSYTAPPDHQPKEDDVILLLRSAGTTGKHRYVGFNHKQVSAAAMAVKTRYHLMSTDRFLTPLNWAHPFAFMHGMMIPLINGATTVIDHGLQAVEFLDFMIESRVTRLVSVPQFLFKLLVICKNEKRVLPGMKSVTVGLGSLSPELVRAFELLKVPVSHCYGQIENLWSIAMQDTQDPLSGRPFERGFVGRGLVGMKYKVVDPQGDEIESRNKRTGLFAVASPSMMKEYMDREKETKMAVRGSWLYTGDLASLDGEGEELTITFVGRKDDVLIIEGQPVQMSQIDAVLKSHPAVQDGAAFAIKDGRDRPVVVCAVVKKAGSQINEKQLMDFVGGKAGAASPRAVAFTDVIPRDAGGNVNCYKLRGQFSGIAG
jgi:long-chain acyl-CoA synthetase